MAVADSLDDIHTDWHWIEQNLFRKIGQIEDAQELFDFLMKQFVELGETAQAGTNELLLFARFCDQHAVQPW